MFIPFLRLFLFSSKHTLQQLLLVILSLALAISFILSNVGLMDGYEKAFKAGLRESGADLHLMSSSGFFTWDQAHQKVLKDRYPRARALPIILSEAFVVSPQTAKGIQLRGVDESAQGALSLKIIPRDDEIILGKQLAQALSVKIGESVQLLFSQGSHLASGLPQAQSFHVIDIVQHSLHMRDSRTAYINRSLLADLVGAGDKVNQVLISLPGSSFAQVEAASQQLDQDFGDAQLFGLWIKPFWAEHTNLMEAVAVEKTMITLALQLVVIVSLFNIISFLYELFTHRERELFLLRALGLSFRQVSFFFLLVIVALWCCSFLLALGLTFLFNVLLREVSWLQIPGKIYELSSLSLSLSIADILWCALGSLGWTLLMTVVSLWRLKRKSLTQVLRGELA